MIIKKVGIEDINELQKIGFDSYAPHYSHLWKPNGIEWYMNRCFGEEFLRKEIDNRQMSNISLLKSTTKILE